MATITVGRENSTSIELYYEDQGLGPAVVLVHGFPLSGRCWERQAEELLAEGYRVITYDRRGYGRSSRPGGGYDADTLASDLNILLAALDLHQTVLVGHSIGTGDVVRYLGIYGAGRITRAVLIAPLQPILLATSDKPLSDGDQATATMLAMMEADRFAAMDAVVAAYFNSDQWLGTRVSPEAVHAAWIEGVAQSPRATIAYLSEHSSGFRPDLQPIKIPVLTILGGADRIAPTTIEDARSANVSLASTSVVIESAPHGLLWTHAPEVNAILLDFIG